MKTINALIGTAVLCAAVFTATISVSAQNNDPGARLFRRCAACHTLEEGGPNRIGPNLYGVFDRDIASLDNFRYSDALLALEGRWTEEAINQFILSPRTYAKGTKMAFAGIRKTADREALIAWLKDKTAGSSTTADTSAGNTDPDLALLPDDSGKQETFDGCASCHSIKLVVQQGMNKDEWLETIEWMVDEQGMDPLEDDLNDVIATYLATHFGRDRPNFPQ